METIKGSDTLGILRPAMSGSHRVHGVTHFWERFEGEYQRQINLVDAVADAGVGHFTVSTPPSMERLTEGALWGPHFDPKACMDG